MRFATATLLRTASLVTSITSVVAISLAAGAPVFADSVTIPSAFASTEGNVNKGFGAALTYQVVYDSSLLTGLNVGDQITGLTFRLNGVNSSSPALLTQNFDVYLGPSNFAAGSLSDSVVANQGTGTVQVQSGALSLAANAFTDTGGLGPNPFGQVITFNSSYTYTGSNLLLTVSSTAFNANILLDANTGTVGTQLRQAFSYNALTTDLNFLNYTPITQLQVERAVVSPTAPEPGSAALLLSVVGAGIFVAGKQWRRRYTGVS
ncbi:MAG: hypothetical protein H7Z41_19055 [Cytophagales bacterium]|nr:hypothetical protein [Armatimonadota bacterium]